MTNNSVRFIVGLLASYLARSVFGGFFRLV